MSNSHVEEWHQEAIEAGVRAVLAVAKKRDMQSMKASDIVVIFAGMIEVMTVQDYGMISDVTEAIHAAAKDQLNGPDNAS